MEPKSYLSSQQFLNDNWFILHKEYDPSKKSEFLQSLADQKEEKKLRIGKHSARLEIKGFGGDYRATLAAIEIINNHSNRIARKWTEIINNIRYSKKHYLHFQTKEGKKIAISINSILNRSKFIDKQAVLDQTKLGFSTKQDVLKAYQDGTLQSDLERISKIRQHYERIVKNYKNVTCQAIPEKGKVKVTLQNGDLAISGRRLLKIIESTFGSDRTQAQIVLGKPKKEKKNFLNAEKFCVKEEEGTLKIISLPHKIAEGSFTRIYKFVDVSNGFSKIIKRPKLASEFHKAVPYEKSRLAEQALDEFRKEYRFLNKVGGQWGIVAKPQAAIEIVGHMNHLQNPARAILKGPVDSPMDGSNFNAFVQDIYEKSLADCITEFANMPMDSKFLAIHPFVYAAAYLAKNDIVHGDIKPENLLILRDEYKRIYLYLIDFGTANEGYIPEGGTCAYMSPEDNAKRYEYDELILKGTPQNSRKTLPLNKIKGRSLVQAGIKLSNDQIYLKNRWDSYSVGTVIYRILTGGKFPYKLKGKEDITFPDHSHGGLSADDPSLIEACRTMSQESGEKLRKLVANLLTPSHKNRMTPAEALEKLQAIIHDEYPGSCENVIVERSGKTFAELLQSIKPAN